MGASILERSYSFTQLTCRTSQGYRIFGLSVGENLPPTAQPQSLRDSAIWFPTVPPPDLYLNEDSFHQKEPATGGAGSMIYPPLCWVSFGGPGGTHLRSLTGLTARFHRGCRSIQFHYGPPAANDANPSKSRCLGWVSSYSEYGHFSHFPIDGVGGEIIETVDLELHPPDDYDRNALQRTHGVFRALEASFFFLSGVRFLSLRENVNIYICTCNIQAFSHDPLQGSCS